MSFNSTPAVVLNNNLQAAAEVPRLLPYPTFINFGLVGAIEPGKETIFPTGDIPPWLFKIPLHSIKFPEILFEQDSTTVYLYLQKTKTNKFDGLIGFNTNDQGKLKFNGYIDLYLNNLLNKGESLSINWKSNSESSCFYIAYRIHYRT